MQDNIISVGLHESTVKLLDEIIADENRFFNLSGDSSNAWNRARFIDMLIHDYHEDVHED